jgi:hypothetical protein
MKAVLTLLLVLVGLVSMGSLACGSNEIAMISGVRSDNDSAIDIPFSHPSFLPANYWPQCADSFNVVIRSEEEWRSLSAAHTLWLVYPRSDVPPQPDVDFDSEILIFMCGGVHPTGGYSLSIRAVTLCSDKLVVTYEEQSPGPDDVVTQAFTYTGDIVKVPRYELPVESVRVADPL